MITIPPPHPPSDARRTAPLRRAVIALLVLSVSIAAGAQTTTPRNVPVLPASAWTLVHAEGDSVRLAEQDGCLGVRYRVDIKGLHQVGHVTYNQATFRLMLRQPIPLTAAESRVSFEALGMEQIPRTLPSVVLFPIIRDGTGEQLYYHPFPGYHLKAGSTNWSTWLTRDLYSGEAGGATMDIYEAEGGDGNAWPDGRLALAGFQVQVRGQAFGPRQGELFLGTVNLLPTHVPYEDPYVHADSLLTQPGRYRIAACISTGFQAPPLREFVTDLNYDPQSIASRRQRIRFPLGPDGNYWITYQAADAKGTVVAGDVFRYQVLNNTGAVLPPPVDGRQEPALGYLRLNPDRHSDGVYGPAEPMVVIARLFPRGAGELTLSWQVRAYAYATTLQQGSVTAAYTGELWRDLPITLSPQPGRDAYRLELQVRRNGVEVDKREYRVGRRTDFSQPRTTRLGELLDRDYVKGSAYFRVTYHDGNKTFPTEDAQVTNFREFLDQASQVTRYMTFMIDLADFEVLAGVYDFALLDRVVDAAADRGCALTIRLVHADGHAPFAWLPFSRQYNYDGTPIAGHPFYGGYALTDARYLECWFDAYKALYDRYRLHPGFQGYYILKPGGEWTVLDRPWEGIVAGYAPCTRPVFRQYLREDLKLSLAQLNARWGADFATWDEVQPPQPDFRLGKAPDLRLAWLDFCRFKIALDQSWFETASQRIRRYDTNHVIIAYNGSAEGLVGRVDYLHNGGNHSLNREGTLMDAWKGGTGWITEPHSPHRWADYGDPAEMGWVLDWSTYVMMAQAGGGGANLHVYYYPNPTLSLPAHYGGVYAYDRLEQFKPILRELHTVRILLPPVEVAVLQDPTTLYTKHRTTFTERLNDLNRWFDLAKLDSVAYEPLDETHLDRYKLLLPNLLDEVMSRKDVERLDRGVREGACMLMAANTGEYCPELGREPFQLLKRLGIAPPTGAYVLDTTGVTARVVADNPLFASDSRLAFYTLADMQRDLQSPKVRAHFWDWPYRWIPQTDYFGYYRDNPTTNGKVLARFPSGGVALSLHEVGKGRVIVFWGTPDCTPSALKGMMARAAAWAGVHGPRMGSPIPGTLEGRSDSLKRHYALFYQETPGAYTQPLPQTPDGDWFLDDMVSGQRFGLYTGKELRDPGLTVNFIAGCSPLKIIRMLPRSQIPAPWVTRYRTPEKD